VFVAMNKTEVEKALDEFGARVIEKARKRLSDGNTNASGSLSKSLNFQSKVSTRSFEFDFFAEDYWKFIDAGVKGKVTSTKAPKSPYRFGSGTGRKGGLTAGIDKWVIRKGISGTRGKDGRFLKRKELVRAIARSVYMTGIKPTEFFSKSFEEEYKKLEASIGQYYGNDIEQFLKKNL
jgi:hypothetical protein